MGLETCNYLLAMPELQLAHEKMEQSKKDRKMTLKNVNIERVVYFLMLAVVILSYILFNTISTLLIIILLCAGSLTYIVVPLAKFMALLLKKGEETPYGAPVKKQKKIILKSVNTERIVFFLTWTWLIFSYVLSHEITGHNLVVALLGAGFTIFIVIPLVKFMVTFPRTVGYFYETVKENFTKIVILFVLSVWILPHLFFNQAKADKIIFGLYVIGVAVFMMFFIAKLVGTIPKNIKDPLKRGITLAYCGVVLILVLLMLFGVWAYLYEPTGAIGGVYRYAEYIIVVGIAVIYLLMVLIRRKKGEKGIIVGL